MLKNVNDNVVSKFQTLGMCMMSFMHGAQDGQKFIGILIIYYYIVNGMSVPDYIVPSEHIVTILFVAVVMLIGVSMGGKKIVENIGSNVTNLTKKQALFSDVATSITLLIASLNGLPVSTTHAKTVAIIGVGKSEKQQVSKKAITQIIKAWFLTFPVCLLISFFLAKIFINFN